MDSEGDDLTFCPETVELMEWDTGLRNVLHACEKGEHHDGGHKCGCGQRWDAEVPC